MKRRKFLTSIGLMPILLQTSSCKSRFPDAATIIKGRITDEQGYPVEGIRMIMMGTRPLSLSFIKTFEVNSLSNQNGEYILSHVITKESKTRTVDLCYEHNPDLPYPNSVYELYTKRDSRLITQSVGYFVIHSNNYGKATIIDYW